MGAEDCLYVYLFSVGRCSTSLDSHMGATRFVQVGVAAVAAIVVAAIVWSPLPGWSQTATSALPPSTTAAQSPADSEASARDVTPYFLAQGPIGPERVWWQQLPGAWYELPVWAQAGVTSAAVAVAMLIIISLLRSVALLVARE